MTTQGGRPFSFWRDVALQLFLLVVAGLIVALLSPVLQQWLKDHSGQVSPFLANVATSLSVTWFRVLSVIGSVALIIVVWLVWRGYKTKKAAKTTASLPLSSPPRSAVTAPKTPTSASTTPRAKDLDRVRVLMTLQDWYEAEAERPLLPIEIAARLGWEPIDPVINLSVIPHLQFLKGFGLVDMGAMASGHITSAGTAFLEDPEEYGSAHSIPSRLVQAVLFMQAHADDGITKVPQPRLRVRLERQRSDIGYTVVGGFENVGDVRALDLRADFPHMPRWRRGQLIVGEQWSVEGAYNQPAVDASIPPQPGSVEFSDGVQVYRQETMVEFPSVVGSNMRDYRPAPLGPPYRIEQYSIPK